MLGREIRLAPWGEFVSGIEAEGEPEILQLADVDFERVPESLLKEHELSKVRTTSVLPDPIML